MRKIFLYGSGNMSWALAKSFIDNGIKVSGITGRNKQTAEELANQLNIQHCHDIISASQIGDIVVLAVKDDALLELNQVLKLPGRLVLHTSGSVELDAISNISENIGVFYPMERVIKFQEPNFKNVPLCIEANTSKMLDDIRILAQILSDKIYELSSFQRKNLHIAAVLVSNFTTHMIALGGDLIEKYELPKTVLDSLIHTTFEGLTTQNASTRQTGPAKRGDVQVIENHISQLKKEQPDLAELYKSISYSILKRYHPNPK